MQIIEDVAFECTEVVIDICNKRFANVDSRTRMYLSFRVVELMYLSALEAIRLMERSDAG